MTYHTSVPSNQFCILVANSQKLAKLRQESRMFFLYFIVHTNVHLHSMDYRSQELYHKTAHLTSTCTLGSLATQLLGFKYICKKTAPLKLTSLCGFLGKFGIQTKSKFLKYDFNNSSKTITNQHNPSTFRGSTSLVKDLFYLSL